MATDSVAKNRVLKGSKLLNVSPRVPQVWQGRINLFTLDLSDGEVCILGQLFKYYSDGLDELNLNSEDAAEYGFVDDIFVTAKQLTEAWTEYLKEWRGNNITTPKPEYRKGIYSDRVFRTLGVITTVDGDEHVAYEAVTFEDGKEIGGGHVLVSTKASYHNDTREHVPFIPTVTEVGHYWADLAGSTRRMFYFDGEKLWRLTDSPSHAPESYWENQGYRNFVRVFGL